ncbi:restriction endonuclease subunit S [SAR202 cluster bacterium JH702]|uniref:Restriction endonuclease subunit S n=1 Tax=Candidatus Lucifugimonas marina TaxID=3038979 RepID=A0ABD4XMU0_9CHLR|nr:restriction endonuclease subunit S [SAR202 cluster bacterium JH702]
MREGWRSSTLGDACDLIKRGITPKYIEDTGIRILNQKCVRDHAVDYSLARRHDSSLKRVPEERIVRLGDVLVNSTGVGTLGRVAQIRNEFEEAVTVDSHVTIVRPKQSIFYLDFFGYMMIRIESQIAESGEGASGQTELSRSSLAQNFKVQYPESLSQQQRIVAILDEAFAGIASAVESAEKNLNNATQIFDNYLNGALTQTRDGWETTVVGDLCTLKSGTTVSKNLEKPSGDLPYLKVADMNFPGNEMSIISSSRFLDMSDISKSAVFPVGTTIFPKRGGAIATNKKRITETPICTDLNVMGVIPPSNLLPKLLYYYFQNVDMRELGSGSSIPQINNYDIEPMSISFPRSEDEQSKIVEQLDTLGEQTHRLLSIYREKLDALTELKKSILQKAFSGELTAEPDKTLAEAGL